MKSNFEETFLKFIETLKVPVTKSSALEYLGSHPNEGSLLAYAETLERFKIENAGIKIEKDRFDELPTPFVAYLHQYGGTFALVKEVHGNEVSWLNTQKGLVKTAKEDFLKTWQGIALLAETSSESGENGYVEKRKSEIRNGLRIPLAIVLLALIIGIFSIPAYSSIPFFLLLKIIGVVVSSLLLIKSVDSKNELVNKLCNNGPKVNCQSILDSPAASITSWLNWSDLGFLYFSGSFISLLLCFYSGTLNTFFTSQWFFSAGSILFSVYSLWYQGVKSKLWCTLCLAVVSVFVAEFWVLLVFAPFKMQVDFVGTKYIFAGFAIPAVFLLLYKDAAQKTLEQNTLKRKLNKVYANPAYYKAIMQEQPTMPPIPEDIPAVFFGSTDAEHTITIVSNPLCSPCAVMHGHLEELVEENPNVKCQVIFLSGGDNAGGQFVRKLFSLPHDMQARALSEWFTRNDKNFEKWGEAYKLYNETEKAADIQDIHNNWVNYAEIKSTPTLFINGKKRAEGLSVKDLGAMLMLQKAATSD